MLEQKRLWGEGKTIERRVSLPPIVSAEGFTPKQCRHEWRHGTQECVRPVQAPISRQALGCECSANGLRRAATVVRPYK